MKVLIVEDTEGKAVAVRTEVENVYRSGSLDIVLADTFALATKRIFEDAFDLIIADLMVPLRTGETEQDITEELLSTVELSSLNRGTNVLALTAFEELVSDQRQRFADAGIVVVLYDEAEEAWRKNIRIALSRIRERSIFDFIIICALDIEREAYKKAGINVVRLENIRGLDCMIMEIADYRGACVKMPRMGLVNASILTARCLERFSPRIVAMSGICAGVEGNSDLGTLVIADPCFEYQTGKWLSDGFKVEHYDVGLPISLRTALSQLIAEDPKGARMKDDLLEDPVRFQPIVIEPVATGSAVIADSAKMMQIVGQHRKMAGLDMEMYGLYKAADLSASSPVFFGAKTVVDMADKAKDSRLHEYGCIVSARFVVAALSRLLAE